MKVLKLIVVFGLIMVKLLTAEEQAKLPTAHLDEGFKVDSGFWSDYGTELNEKFNAWLLKK